MPHSLRSNSDHPTALDRVAGALTGTSPLDTVASHLTKGLVHGYTRHVHGVAQVVPDHIRHNPAALVGLLAKRYHHQLSLDFSGGGGGAVSHGDGNGGTVQRAPQAGGDQEVAAGSIEQASHHPGVPTPTPVVHLPGAPKGTHPRMDRSEARKTLEDAHRKLAVARQLEEDAKLEPSRRDALLARANTLRAELQTDAGPDYERAIEGKLVANYAPELGKIVADWASKVRVPVERDAKGRPTGSFGLLHAEALDAAYQAVHRYRTHNRTSLFRLVKGQVEQRLFRHWQRAIGKGAYNVSQQDQEHMSKLSRLIGAHIAATGQHPTDEALAEALGVSPQRVGEIKQLAAVSLGESMNQTNEDGVEMGDRLAWHGKDPGSQVEADEVADAVHLALADLDPLKRATVRVAHGMGLDEHTAQQLAEHMQLHDLAEAMADHAHVEDPDARAHAAVAAVKWRAPVDAPLRAAAAKHLAAHGLDPVEALMAPEQRADGDKHELSVSEVHRRVGLKAANSGSVLRSAEQALARHAALVGFRDALHKSLLMPFPSPWGSLLAAIAPTALLASLPAPLAALASPLLEDDQHGWAQVRHDRTAEAAILAAAAQGGDHEAVYGDGAGS